MSLLDTILGRTKPKRPELSALFSLPSAAVTLETAAGLKTAGKAAVAFKTVSGGGFAATSTDLDELLQFSAKESNSKLSQSDDSYGYHWVVVSDPELEDLVGTAHAVNTTLEEQGFGPQLLCSVFPFVGDAHTVNMVYLYKRGTFYPFAPAGNETRDNQLELKVRALLERELSIEKDLARWYPLWGIPLD
jgi:PspA associated protein B